MKAGEDRLLDLIERQRPAGDMMLQPLERAGNLPNAFRRVLGRAFLDRIMIDHRLQHEGVVRIQPERQPLLARRLVDRLRRKAADEPIELRAFELERAVIHVAVTHVEIQDLIERLAMRVERGFLCVRRRDDRARDQHDVRPQRSQRPQST